MRWYWEPGHFKSTLGDLIGCRLSGQRCEYSIGNRLYPISEKPHEVFEIPQFIIDQSTMRIEQVI
jgi:hypothetical protein